MRSLWLCSVFHLVGWPRIVDIALGARRANAGSTPCHEVWREGETHLYRYRGAARHPEPVLLVHALVTTPIILDLTPQRSLVKSLVEQGFDVFLLDWGVPGARESARGLRDYSETLTRAEKRVLAVSGASRLHVVGYCSAATLCLVTASAWPHPHLASLALIAPPVDFSVPGGMRRVLGSRILKPALVLDSSGCVPPVLVRESFHSLRWRGFETVRAGFRGRKNYDFRVNYLALARWVGEHRPMPGALLFDFVDLYRTNSLLAGGGVPGLKADLGRIEAPVLVAVAERDHIVPPGSSLALSSVPGLSVEILRCASGHVSMVAGSTGVRTFWPGLGDWLARHQSQADPQPDAPAERPMATRSGKRAKRLGPPRPSNDSVAGDE